MKQLAETRNFILASTSNKASYNTTPSFHLFRAFVVLLFLSFFTVVKANAQTTTCTISDACFDFGYKYLRSADNKTVTITVSLKVNCGTALSHVAFELPKDVKISIRNSNTAYSYKKVEYTSNPFYSANMEVTGEGIKNGQQDTYTYTLTSEQFAQLTTLRVQAKTATRVGTVAFNPQGCTSTNTNTSISSTCVKPTVNLTGPETICNLSDEPYTFSAGTAQGGTTYNYTLPEGFYIIEGEGTSTITVQTFVDDSQLNTPMTVSVTATNLCGSTTRQMDVIVKDCNTAKSLPVELLSFSGSVAFNKANLSWITASEKNNDRFEVERSTNGIDFVKIGQVQGNGNSLVKRQYSFSDAQPSATTSYYRLKQVDFDGAYEYSKVIAIEMKAVVNSTISVEAAYPNPFQDNLQVRFNLASEATAHVSLYNMAGKAVILQQILGKAGSNQTELNGMGQLTSGVYILKVSAGNQIFTQRILKSN